MARIAGMAMATTWANVERCGSSMAERIQDLEARNRGMGDRGAHVAALRVRKGVHDPRSGGPGGARHGVHVGEVAVAVEHQVATGVARGRGAGSEGAGERFHTEIVAHEHALEADLAADDVVDDPFG